VQIGEHWQINGGLRWDRFDLEYIPDGGGLEERKDTMTSYRAGVVYKPVEAGSIYFGYGTSFNPSSETLSFSNRDLDRGIAELDPEENRSFEVGTKWEVFDRQLFVSAAVFRTEKTNGRVLDSEGLSYILDGEQLVNGFEFGLAGNVTEAIVISAGYTHLDTEVEDTGNKLGNSPENSLSLWTTYQATGDLQLGFGAQYVDDRYNNESNARTAPDYTIYEVSANYIVNDKIGLRLNLQNLTNEEYIDYVGGGHFIPGLGRTALLTTNFIF
jgi:catecholate siderophore receptor